MRPAKRILIFALVSGLFVTSGPAASQRWKFGFGETPPSDQHLTVTPTTVISSSDYGFESDSSVHAGRVDPGIGYIASKRPFRFSTRVPEGNYRVKAVFVGVDTASSITIKAESRRLMVEQMAVLPNEKRAVEFVVNVRHSTLPAPPLNAPGGNAVRLNDREEGHLNWDDKLTLEFNGLGANLVSLEIETVEVPTVYLAGDSTVTDQRWEPGASWGQMLPRFFRPSVAISNHAESGETLKSFITALRFDKILSTLKPGDYVFVQFGHNDSKRQWPQTYADAGTTFPAYLKTYLAEIRRRGATPVLVTSMHRRRFDSQGVVLNTHGDYPEAVRMVAREEKVALIDLHAKSAILYQALGPERSALAFSAGGADLTHHNNYGAYQLARCVVAGIREANLSLAEHLLDSDPYDPAKPDVPETFLLPPSAEKNDLVPRGN